MPPGRAQVFDHVIEYLRTVRFSDAELPLPRGRAELALLVREADFYGLPGLSAKVLRRRCPALLPLTAVLLFLEILVQLL